MVLSVSISFLAAYPFARLDFFGKRTSFLLIMSFRMLPPVVLLVPIFLLFRRLGLLDSHIGLALSYAALQLPIVVWLLTSFLRDLPKEVESAARMDGCTRLGSIFRVVLPLAAPGLSAVAIFSFMGAWREFLFPLVLAMNRAQVLSVSATEVNTAFYIIWSRTAAVGVIAVVPGLAVVLLFQRYIIKGIVEGSIKS
jgi:multiple sugar transport system permease protein